MKTSIISRAIGFLRQNLLIIIVVMIIGNLFYFFKSDEVSGSYYEGTIKIRSNSTFYDRLHQVLGKITDSNSGEEIFSKYHSYHNEDHYIFEVNVISRDSSLIFKEGQKIIDSLQKDTMINNYYFQRIENTGKLQKQNQIAFDKVHADSGKSAISEFMITTLMINEFNLANNMMNIRKEFQIFPFLPSDIQLINAPLSEKYLKINLIFFVIGLFIAIAISEFKKSGES